jgi:hypothetical protein
MIEADEPLTVLEKQTFGADARRSSITGRILEQGIGALPVRQQEYLHCHAIERQHGKAAADAMRKKLADADKFVTAQKDMATAKQALEADGVSTAAAET